MTGTVDQATRDRPPEKPASGPCAKARLDFHGPDWKDIRQTARALGFSALEVSELERIYSDRSGGTS